MKNLFKKTKVVYDAHQKAYNVYYKNFLFWKFDRTYRVIDTYVSDEVAKKHAIERATNMLQIVEIYRS